MRIHWVACLFALGCGASEVAAPAPRPAPAPAPAPEHHTSPAPPPPVPDSDEPEADERTWGPIEPLPDGAAWPGVYYSPVFGRLHLDERAGRIEGRWLGALEDRWGELTGEARGNQLRFDWRERGMDSADVERGKGYFIYRRADVPSGKKKTGDLLEGEIGPADAESGTAWLAVKEADVQPNIDALTRP